MLVDFIGSIYVANSKVVDQTVSMCRLIGTFVVHGCTNHSFNMIIGLQGGGFPFLNNPKNLDPSS